MSFTFTTSDHVTPQVNALIERLRNRTALHRAMGHSVAATIRDHVINLVSGSHNTSGKLGASPSNFVGQAAQSVERRAPVADAEGVTIRLTHPFFARAFGNVTIRPQSGLYLTIPLIAAAYNQRAYRVPNLFFWRNKKTGKTFLASALKAAGTKGTIELWYLLLNVVTQRQERGRLPSDGQLIGAALNGAASYFEARRAADNAGGSRA